MPTKAENIVLASGAWALFVLALSTLLQSVDIKYYFIICLTGALVIVQLYGPITIKPGWRMRLYVAIAISVAAFILLTINQVVDIIV